MIAHIPLTEFKKSVNNPKYDMLSSLFRDIDLGEGGKELEFLTLK